MISQVRGGCPGAFTAFRPRKREFGLGSTPRPGSAKAADADAADADAARATGCGYCVGRCLIADRAGRAVRWCAAWPTRAPARQPTVSSTRPGCLHPHPRPTTRSPFPLTVCSAEGAGGGLRHSGSAAGSHWPPCSRSRGGACQLRPEEPCLGPAAGRRAGPRRSARLCTPHMIP